ncbi:nuclear transport factor 2 family protein [Vibrio ostreicida]|uniref:Nuclear transport factor 2 family protein n=1 Tax=Vibrio ostreicida TaxID=526588 RepID=A0ABT8C1K3_9VIBR|nr:nuclear transport factor 2 family protein [Vibrio ostreicida]MDN3612539.1 nuclear transport factor 2 family protein [Vibrio ostreicida]NPD09162.1 nuclear transport factor 2 family protein [Vibrio ostreicida]
MNEFIKAYELALASQDWNELSPLVHDDCVVTFSEGTHKGKEQVEAAFRKTFALIKDETYKISHIYCAIESDSVAVFSFNFDWSGVIDGKIESGGGRGTSTIVRSDKQWQLISEHLGPNA